MSVFDLCERKTIKIRFDFGVRDKPAWRYGDFAVHERVTTKDGWTITHLPTGTQLGNVAGVFDGVEPAIAAMIEIQALRNDWHFGCDAAAQLLELRKQVAAVGKRHGGKVKPSSCWGPHRPDLTDRPI